MNSRTMQLPRLTIAFAALSLLLASTSLLRADDGSRSAGGARPARTAQAAEAKKAEDDGDMFPGVRGISGDEIKRRLAEYERRAQQLERQRQQRNQPSQPNQTPVAERPAPTADAGRQSPEAATEAPPADQAAESPARQKPAQRGRRPQPAPEPVAVVEEIDLASLSREHREYILKLQQQVTTVETMLGQIARVRTEAEAQAAGIGHEPLIHYYLRYQRNPLPQTRAYAQALFVPLYFYRYVVEQCRQATLLADAERRPEDLSESLARHVDALAVRAELARKQSLIAAAELYTRMRQLEAAEGIYGHLRQRYAEDDAVNRSFAAFIRVRDEPKPDRPPTQGNLRVKERLEEEEDEAKPWRQRP